MQTLLNRNKAITGKQIKISVSNGIVMSRPMSIDDSVTQMRFQASASSRPRSSICGAQDNEAAADVDSDSVALTVATSAIDLVD